MADVEVEQTVAFFDLVEASKPTQADAIGRKDLQRRLETMAASVQGAGGTVIKRIGDELMCAFGSPRQGVDAAISLAQALQDFALDDAEVGLRVGLHHGLVVAEDHDLFGDTVNVAARMTSIASPGQIIITEQVRRALRADVLTSVKPFDEVRVKGSQHTRTIYRVLWASRAETLGHTQMPALRSRRTAGTLTLHHIEREIVLAEGSGDVQIGRDSRCELVVRSEMASRFHAVVEAQGGNFVLRDQSTNGTWVRMQGSPVVNLQREALSLLGEGIISLGEAVGGNPGHLIRFTCL